MADRAIAQVESAALKGGYLISNADISLRHQDEQNMVSYTLTLTVQDRDGSEPFELKQYGRLKIENGLIEEIYPDNIRDLASLTYPAA